jgi:hypothetical protein
MGTTPALKQVGGLAATELFDVLVASWQVINEDLGCNSCPE